jgi:hypothetical protein
MEYKAKRKLLEEKLLKSINETLNSLNKAAASKTEKASKIAAKNVAKKFFKAIAKLDNKTVAPKKAADSKTASAKAKKIVKKGAKAKK